MTSLMVAVLVGQAKLEPYTEKLADSLVEFEMAVVPGGKMKVGKDTVEVKPFWMAKTETTWQMLDAFIASGPPSKAYDQSDFAPDFVARPSKPYILPDLGWGHQGYPAININISTAEMFCRWLSSVTKKKYRLPTEAEWELACQGGETAEKLDKDALEKASWHGGNSAKTHPVGKKTANKLGLFDMYGNVGEWAIGLDGKPVLCGASFADGAESANPQMRKKWEAHWQESDPQLPKSRWWLSDGPFAGFRVVREP